MIKMMENYESKLNTMEKREENSQKILKSYKEKVQESYIYRDKASLGEESLQNTIKNNIEKVKKDQCIL